MLYREYFATTAKGLEDLLVLELQELGGSNVRQSRSGVYFSGTLEIAYKACLWSRLANHILLPLSQFTANDPDELYKQIGCIDWLDIMRPDASMKVDVNGQHSTINNTQFIAQKAKDSIVDQIRSRTGVRPTIKMSQSDIVINIYVNRTQFFLSLSLSGESLHKRGYRIETGNAPIRETLAAALLIRSGWLEQLESRAIPTLVDPMCGSGTILIEAALMAYKIAPGLGREYFGFYGWCDHNESIWSEIEEDAEALRDKNLRDINVDLYGVDISQGMVDCALNNINRIGLLDHINVKKGDIRELDLIYNQDEIKTDSGLILFNPPYGERLNYGEEDKLKELFLSTGNMLKNNFYNWRLAIVSSAPDLLKAIGIRSFKKHNFYNGALAVELLRFSIIDSYFMKYETHEQKIKRLASTLETISEHAIMFENRLKKNLKLMRKWANRSHISCYRVYDADLPDFSFAIDIYEDQLHVQEYQPGDKVDISKANVRFIEGVKTIQKTFNCAFEEIHLKVRKKQKGKEQYKKITSSMKYFTIREGMAKFHVNFDDYLDTGIFLDHRIMRHKVATASIGKTLLNLFSYTCTASVQAALAGAHSVTSVDMSNTYLEWGRKNFELNKIPIKNHNFIQSDCLSWLETNTIDYNVIFLDPPTFSNSKRMVDTLDIQRDHTLLITKAMKRLKKGGVLFFSNNYRKFKINPDLIASFDYENISHMCLPEDFKRRPNIHHCYLFRHK
jgi:23S rRNA (guanine2445-N2)-methyltransferase / 23S rRNA (guanine2069-N7)-methyltransferase